MKPFCFVLMPFGQKKDPESGREVDFDAVYSQIIKPAIEAVDMTPLRGDEEMVSGIIHKPMFERLMLCDFAVADLTTANANVYYELGIRHASRPHSTVLMFVDDMRLPFDVAPLRGLPYKLGSDGKPAAPESDRNSLVVKLRTCREPTEDSPLFQLIQDWPRPDIAHLKTDKFRDLVEYSEVYKRKLSLARAAGKEAVAEIARDINPETAEPAVVIDLMLSHRAVKNWDAMIALIDAMPRLISNSVMVREQLGMALNRAGRGDEAIQVLQELIRDHGTSSETNGILGRALKDKWLKIRLTVPGAQSKGLLTQAIKQYVLGFDSDIRDPYPGVNAVTLMEMTDPVDPRQAAYLPVVTFVARKRVELPDPDYWDQATMLELAVLARDQEKAQDYLADALACVRESWEPESTAHNLQLIHAKRLERGEDAAWIAEIVDDLIQAGNAFSS